MLRSIGIAKARFHETLEPGQPPCLNHTAPIHCLLGQACLERESHRCSWSEVRVHGASVLYSARVAIRHTRMKEPTVTRNAASEIYTDGEIYQQVSRHIDWDSQISGSINCRRARTLANYGDGYCPPICRPWDEFLLGNWAKHLAAHCDHAMSLLGTIGPMLAEPGLLSFDNLNISDI